jgi:hypothetical protein
MQDPRVLHVVLKQFFHQELEIAVNLKVEDIRAPVVYSARRPPVAFADPKKRTLQDDHD